MLKECYVAFSVEVLLLNPITLLLMLHSHSARLLVVSAGVRTLGIRQYSETILCLQLLLLQALVCVFINKLQLIVNKHYRQGFSMAHLLNPKPFKFEVRVRRADDICCW